MTNTQEELSEVLTLSGLPGPHAARRLSESEEVLALAKNAPKQSAARMLAAERAAREARQRCNELVATIEEMHAAFAGLVGAQPLLCRLEGLQESSGELRAIVALGNQLRSVGIHESVSSERLRVLEPWHYVCVHPAELVVVGIYDDAELLERSRGEIATLVGTLDPERGLVRVQRLGHEEKIVRLSRALRASPLAPRSQLVLLKGDESWAIDVVPDGARASRFEIPLESLRTEFSDLAGLDAIVAPLVRDAVLRIVRPEVAQRFAIKPWRGAILESRKPGMGKTALVRAYAGFLRELSRAKDFELAVYHVKPGELKSVWHGGDALLVREELCGILRARAERARTRPIFQLVVLDELDSLGKRSGVDLHSAAQSDAVLALLAELDGLVQWDPGPSGAPAHLFWIGMTNRLDRLDPALQRPGRFADFVASMPEPTLESAEAILRVHARGDELPWCVDGEVRRGLALDELSARFLRPALAHVYPAPVLRFTPEGSAPREISAGALLAGAHYEAALNGAKLRPAERALLGRGPEAIMLEDLIDGLIEEACKAARQYGEDRALLAREFDVATRIQHVEVVPSVELAGHRFVDVLAS